jgi:hypothetical protein
MKAALLLAASLGLAPVIGLAQSTPHVYVGASALMSSSRPFRSYNQNHFGPALTIGYQLSPRWAVQSGFSWIWNNEVLTYDVGDANSMYNKATLKGHSDNIIVPLLARYTFTDPASPLHVDALAGGSWQHRTGRSTATYTGAGSYLTESYSGSYNTFSASLGPSVRYTLGTHLDLVANSVMQVALTNSYGSLSDRLSLNTQIGIQYHFGQ